MPIRITSHWSVALTPLLFLPAALEDWASVLDALLRCVYLTLLIQLLVIVPHELGHIMVSRRFGIKRGTLFLGGVCGCWLPDDDYAFDRLSPNERAAVFAAGPAVNFMIAALCFLLSNRWHTHEPLLQAVMEVNAITGLLNLIPIPPLDGGRIFRELLVIGRVRTSKHLACMRFVAVVSGAGWLSVIFKHGYWFDWAIWALVMVAAMYLLKEDDSIVNFHEDSRY